MSPEALRLESVATLSEDVQVERGGLALGGGGFEVLGGLLQGHIIDVKFHLVIVNHVGHRNIEVKV